jgi:putative ABC transport system permease protein
VSNRPAPPSVVERFLGALLRSQERRDAILGDLHEEYCGRVDAGRWRAAAWYVVHAAGIAARILTSELAGVARRDDRPRLPANTGASMISTLGLELRHAFRAILKRPALSLTLAITLALGLGANASIFAMIDALVLRPFTMPDQDRIVFLSHTRDGEIDRKETVSPADFLDLRAQADTLEHIAAIEWWDANLVGRDEPEAVTGFKVSSDFFPALGVQPGQGRMFMRDEETLGRHTRVVLGHALWKRRFAADPAVVGSTVQIDGMPHEVIGVAPEGFDFPMGAQVWAPLAFTKEIAERRRSRYLTVVGRLAPGRTLEEAKSQLTVIGERLEAQHPDTNRGYKVRVYTLAQGMLDVGLGPILSLWQASAIFVLLIVCANVASLLLARGAERQREIAVRLAIGASRARIVRELLMESAIVALAAIPAALALVWVALALLKSSLPAKMSRFVAGWNEMNIDLRLFAFIAGLALLTALVFGIVPALQAVRPKLSESLKEGGRSVAGTARFRLRRGLVIGEMALSLPLLVACGLSILSVNQFLNGPQGFNPDNLITVQTTLSEGTYGSTESRWQFAERVIAGLKQSPGVLRAAATNNLPASGSNNSRFIEVEGQPVPTGEDPFGASYRAVSPGYFAAMEIPILSGRGISEADRENSLDVAVVSKSLVDRHWPGQDALGRRIRMINGEWLTIVGVSGDVIHDWFAGRNRPTFYRPMAQAPVLSMAFVTRTKTDPGAVAPTIRDVVRTVDPKQPVFELLTMREVLRDRTTGLRFVAAIMIVFGGIALLLAILGVYGVMAHMVTQRTHEIGVRMALGATQRDVVRLSILHAARLTAVGAALGVVLAVGLSRLIEAGLLGVISSDFRVVSGFAVVLIGAGLAAGYIPARRASSINPIVALRAE